MKATTTLATGTTPDGATLLLQEHDGEHYLKVGGVQLMSTRAPASEQQMADVACGRGAKRVLIGGLGFGFTLRRTLELVPTDAVVEVAELLPVIVEWNRKFLAEVNGRLLDDPRVLVTIGDVYDCLNGKNRYDAILLDVDNGPDALVQRGNGRLYGRRALERVKATLNPGGRVVYWSANQDKGFAKELAAVFRHVECLSAKSHPRAKRFTHTLFVADR